VIRAPIAKLAEGTRTLDAQTSSYLCRVLRLRAGDTFVAFDPAARVDAEATLEEADGRAARVVIGPVRPAEIVARTPVTLVYALAKGDKVDAVVRDATELGVTDVHLTPSEHAVVKIDAAKRDSKLQRWQRIAEEAARQCGRGDSPRIHLAETLLDALKAANAHDRFLLDPRAEEPLGRHLRAGVSTAFAIGPEGGFSPGEIELAKTEDYRPVTLGSFVLRTETVAAAVLGALRVLDGK
jgi:16S rRNA (uracil1498-N3)-methyltransferase